MPQPIEAPAKPSEFKRDQEEGEGMADYTAALKRCSERCEFKLAELLETLSNHFQLKPIIIAEHFHFHKRDQEEGEGMADYTAALKRCSERCEFGGFLEQALRDRFVCGLRNRQIQKRLLTETELTWKKALDTSKAMESVEKQANHLRPVAPPSNINVLPARTQNKKGITYAEQTRQKQDQSIASVVRDCAKCQLTRNKPQIAPLHSWDWPDTPWQRIHIDFAGPFVNKNLNLNFIFI